MAFISKDAALEMMKELNIKFFNILDTDRSVIFRQQDAELSEKAALDKLSDLLEGLEGSWVHVQLRTKSGKQINEGGDLKSGNMDLKVRLTSNGMSGTNNDSSALSNSQMMQLMHQLSDTKAELAALKQRGAYDRLQMEFDAFKKEMKDKREENPIIQQGIGALMAYLGSKGAAPQQQAQAINGPEDVNKGEMIKEGLKRIMKVDTDFHNTLTMLADYAEKHPEQYRAFIPMLKSQI